MANDPRIVITVDGDIRPVSKKVENLDKKFGELRTIPIGVDDDKFKQSLKNMMSEISLLGDRPVTLTFDNRDAQKKLKDMQKQLGETPELMQGKLENSVSKQLQITDREMKKRIAGSTTFSIDEDELKTQLSSLADYVTRELEKINNVEPVKLLGDNQDDLTGYDNQIASLKKISRVINIIKQNNGKAILPDFLNNINADDITARINDLTTNAVSKVRENLKKQSSNLQKDLNTQAQMIIAGLSFAISNKEDLSSGTAIDNYIIEQEKIRNKIQADIEEKENRLKLYEWTRKEYTKADLEDLYSILNHAQYSDDNKGAKIALEDFFKGMHAYRIQGGSFEGFDERLIDEYKYANTNPTKIKALDQIKKEAKEAEKLMADIQNAKKEAYANQDLLEYITPDITPGITPNIEIYPEDIAAEIEMGIRSASASPDIVIQTEEIKTEIEDAIKSVAINPTVNPEELQSSLNGITSAASIIPEVDYGFTTNKDFLFGKDQKDAFKSYKEAVNEVVALRAKEQEFINKGYNLDSANPQQKGWLSDTVEKLNKAEAELKIFQDTYSSVMITLASGEQQTIDTTSIEKLEYNLNSVKDVAFELRKIPNTFLDVDINIEKIKSDISDAIMSADKNLPLKVDQGKIEADINTALATNQYNLLVNATLTGDPNNVSDSLEKVIEKLKTKNELISSSSDQMERAVAREIDALKQLANHFDPIIVALEKMDGINFAGLAEFVKSGSQSPRPTNQNPRSNRNNGKNGNPNDEIKASYDRELALTKAFYKEQEKLASANSPYKKELAKNNIKALREERKKIRDEREQTDEQLEQDYKTKALFAAQDTKRRLASERKAQKNPEVKIESLYSEMIELQNIANKVQQNVSDGIIDGSEDVVLQSINSSIEKLKETISELLEANADLANLPTIIDKKTQFNKKEQTFKDIGNPNDEIKASYKKELDLHKQYWEAYARYNTASTPAIAAASETELNYLDAEINKLKEKREVQKQTNKELERRNDLEIGRYADKAQRTIDTFEINQDIPEIRIKEAYKELNKLMKIRIQMQENINNGTEEYSKDHPIIQTIKALRSEIEGLIAADKELANVADIVEQQQVFLKRKDTLKNLIMDPNGNSKSTDTSTPNQTKADRGTKSLDRLLSDFNSRYKKINKAELIDTDNLNAAESKIKTILELYERMIKNADFMDTLNPDQINEYKQLINEMEDLLDEVTKADNRKVINGAKVVKTMEGKSIQEIDQDMIDALREVYNQKKGKDLTYKRINNGYKGTFITPEGKIVEYTAKMNNLAKVTTIAQTAEKDYVSSGQKMINSFKTKIAQISQYVGLIDIMREAFGKVKEGVTIVRDMDTAMTELKKVSDAPIQTYKNFPAEASKIAKAVGSTSIEITNAAADWARLGESIPDSKEMAKVAALYKNVGDGIDIDTANQSLISTMKGFQLQTSDALSVVDKFNEVANHFPIDSAGIGEALQRSAASFHAANTDLSESIALVTATNSVLQDPARVGKHCLPAQ